MEFVGVFLRQPDNRAGMPDAGKLIVDESGKTLRGGLRGQMRERRAELPISRNPLARAGEGLADVLAVRPLCVGWRRFWTTLVNGRAVTRVQRIS